MATGRDGGRFLTESSENPPDSDCNNSSGGVESGGEGGMAMCQSNSQSLVSTVCHRGKLLKSLFHLPLTVFEDALEARGIQLLQARIGRAVGGILESQGMRRRDVVRAMAWFDVNKVRTY